MMKRLELVAVLMSILFVSVNITFADVVTFDEFVDPNQISAESYGGDVLTIKGLNFQIAQLSPSNLVIYPVAWQNQRDNPNEFQVANNGTNHLGAFSAHDEVNYGDTAAMMIFSETPFCLNSLEVAESGWRYNIRYSPVVDFTFWGHKTSGETITFSFTMDGVLDGSGGQDDFETITFNNSWCCLDTIEVFTEFNPQNPGPYGHPLGAVTIFKLDNIDFYLIPTVDDIIDFIHDNMDIVGVGPGKSASNKYNAFMKMLQTVADLMEDGDNEGACDQLNSIMKKCDGLPKPADFIDGDTDTVGTLIGMLDDLMMCFECE